eukprot:SAG31_NODE_39677_length_286_cov_1.090909_1_plen_82_part_10
MLRTDVGLARPSKQRRCASGAQSAVAATAPQGQRQPEREHLGTESPAAGRGTESPPPGRGQRVVVPKQTAGGKKKMQSRYRG